MFNLWMNVTSLVAVTGAFILITFFNVTDRNYALAVVWQIISHANVALTTIAIGRALKEKECGSPSQE